MTIWQAAILFVVFLVFLYLAERRDPRQVRGEIEERIELLRARAENGDLTAAGADQVAALELERLLRRLDEIDRGAK